MMIMVGIFGMRLLSGRRCARTKTSKGKVHTALAIPVRLAALVVARVHVDRRQVWRLVTILCALTTISSVLDNVTTILLVVPVSIRLCEVLNINPIPCSSPKSSPTSADGDGVGDR